MMPIFTLLLLFLIASVRSDFVTCPAQDTTAPSQTCPADITLECSNGDFSPTAAGSATATDNCAAQADITVTTSDNVISGHSPNSWVIQRTWGATDQAQNSAACTQRIQVVDWTSPVPACPADITVECSSNTYPPTTGTASATDNCDGTPSVSFSDDVVDGTTDNNYVIQRTWTAYDDDGNSGSCLQVIQVLDTTSPSFLTCPSAMTLECEGFSLEAMGTPITMDNCDFSHSLAHEDLNMTINSPDDFFLIRRWTATDADDNFATCDTEITVQDTTPPDVACSAALTFSCNACKPGCGKGSGSGSGSKERGECCELPSASGTTTAVDNCDPNPIVRSIDALQIGTLQGFPCNYNIIRLGIGEDRTGNLASCASAISVVNGDTLNNAGITKKINKKDVECDMRNNSAPCIDICQTWASSREPGLGVLPSFDPINDFRCVGDLETTHSCPSRGYCDCKFVVSVLQFCITSKSFKDCDETPNQSGSKSGGNDCDGTECPTQCSDWLSEHVELSGYIMYDWECRDKGSKSNSGSGNDCCYCKIDLDECAAEFDNCRDPRNRECINTLGGYECGACVAGYEEDSPPGWACVEIGPLILDTGSCDDIFKSANEYGGVCAPAGNGGGDVLLACFFSDTTTATVANVPCEGCLSDTQMSFLGPFDSSPTTADLTCGNVQSIEDDDDDGWYAKLVDESVVGGKHYMVQLEGWFGWSNGLVGFEYSCATGTCSCSPLCGGPAEKKRKRKKRSNRIRANAMAADFKFVL